MENKEQRRDDIEQRIIDLKEEKKKMSTGTEKKALPSRSIRSVKMEVCGMFGITEEDLAGKSRSKTMVLARKMFAIRARRDAGASLTEIGKELGGRGHTVIMYYLSSFKDEYKTEGE